MIKKFAKELEAESINSAAAPEPKKKKSAAEAKPTPVVAEPTPVVAEAEPTPVVVAEADSPKLGKRKREESAAPVPEKRRKVDQ